MSLIFALDSQIYLLSLLDGTVNEAIHARTKETFAIYAGAIECALLPRRSSPVGDDIRLAGICFETELVLFMNGRQRVQQLNDRGLSKILHRNVHATIRSRWRISRDWPNIRTSSRISNPISENCRQRPKVFQ